MDDAFEDAWAAQQAYEQELRRRENDRAEAAAERASRNAAIHKWLKGQDGVPASFVLDEADAAVAQGFIKHMVDEGMRGARSLRLPLGQRLVNGLSFSRRRGAAAELRIDGYQVGYVGRLSRGVQLRVHPETRRLEKGFGNVANGGPILEKLANAPRGPFEEHVLNRGWRDADLVYLCADGKLRTGESRNFLVHPEGFAPGVCYVVHVPASRGVAQRTGDFRSGPTEEEYQTPAYDEHHFLRVPFAQLVVAYAELLARRPGDRR